MDFKIKKIKYKSTFFIGIIFSFFAHSLFAYYLVYDYHHNPIEVKKIKIEEVEFLEKSKIIEKRLKLKERQEKIKKKEEKKIEKEEKRLEKELKKIEKQQEQEKEKTPLLEDKKLPLLESKKIELKFEKKELEAKSLDFKVQPKTSMKVKSIDDAPTLIEKNRPVLNSGDVQKLLNLNEVGDKKVSQQTLDLANKLKQEVRVKKVIDSPKIDLNEKAGNLVNLDKKIASFESAPVINISKKAIEADTNINKVKKVGAGFNVNEMTVLEEKEAASTKSGKLKKVVIVEEKAVQIIKEKPVEVVPVAEKKKVEVNKGVVPKPYALKEVTGVHEKKKDFEILGAIKNRPIEQSIAPEYPEWAKAQRIEANVRVYIEVNKQGNVVPDTVQVDITSGYKKLDDYVIEVVKKWKFVPISENETQNGTITFRFKLY